YLTLLDGGPAARPGINTMRPSALMNRCPPMISPFISVGPTVQFSKVHRFAASSQLAGPPTPEVGIHTISFLISVGPTVQFSKVHRFAASSQLAGPPTPEVGIHTISFLKVFANVTSDQVVEVQRCAFAFVDVVCPVGIHHQVKLFAEFDQSIDEAFGSLVVNVIVTGAMHDEEFALQAVREID